MLLNNIEVEILGSIELEDAYNKNFSEDLIIENVIYCIHNKVNGKNYVGQTTNLRWRFSTNIIGHFKCYNDFIGGNPIRGKYLYRAWNKYGFRSFTVYIIDKGADRSELNSKEVYWIKTLHTCTKDPECFGYNLTWGADDLGHLSTPEAREKCRQTKIERYGTTNPFINSHTDEAKEKRKQTIIKRFGSTSTVTSESLEKMYKTKMERYGSIVHNLFDREKASHNKKVNDFFSKVEIVKSKSENFTLQDYFDYLDNSYTEIKRVTRHFNKIIEMFDDLRGDNRWEAFNLDTVFCTTPEELKNQYESLYLKRLFGVIKPISGVRYSEYKSAVVNLESINYILDNYAVSNWEDYKVAACARYVENYYAKRCLNRLIDILPILKSLDKWTSTHERIFGHLTEKDKV